MIFAIAGLGTSGTQTLIYGFGANYYRTNDRGAGCLGAPGSTAWAASVDRWSGAGLGFQAIPYTYAGVALFDPLLSLLARSRLSARHDHDACGADTQYRTGYQNRRLNPVPLMLSRTWDVVRWRQPNYERILVEST